MSPNPSTVDEVAVGDDVRESTMPQAEATEEPYVKFSTMLLIAIVLCLATLCVAVDNTIISTAVPRITRDFHSIDDVGWYAA